MKDSEKGKLRNGRSKRNIYWQKLRGTYSPEWKLSNTEGTEDSKVSPKYLVFEWKQQRTAECCCNCPHGGSPKVAASEPVLFFQTYVNTTLYEKFTYAGIDCSAEEAA